MNFTTQKSLDGCLKFYQELLGLYSWTMKIEYSLLEDMPRAQYNSEPLASGVFVREIKTAFIQICSSLYPLGKENFARDEELDIVHELMHIVYPDPKGTEKNYELYMLYEQATETTAQALVKLRRDSKKTFWWTKEEKKKKCSLTLKK